MRRQPARDSIASRVREGFVEGAGARIYFKTMGRGVPLLLLHGGPGADHSDFLPALKPLARRHQLVLIDERGSGRSERLADPTRLYVGVDGQGYRVRAEAFATGAVGSARALLRRHPRAGLCRSVIRRGCWVWCSPARGRVPGASTRISATCANACRRPCVHGWRIAKGPASSKRMVLTLSGMLRHPPRRLPLICMPEPRRGASKIRHRSAWKYCGKCGYAAPTFASTEISKASTSRKPWPGLGCRAWLSSGIAIWYQRQPRT